MNLTFGRNRSPFIAEAARQAETESDAAVERAMKVLANGGSTDEALAAMDEGRKLHEPAGPAWGGMGYDGSRTESDQAAKDAYIRGVGAYPDREERTRLREEHD